MTLLLMSANVALAQVVGDPPITQFVFGSDVVGWHLIGDPARRRLLFQEGRNFAESSTNLTSYFGGPPVTAPAGAASRVLLFTEPPGEPLEINDPAFPRVSDIAAVQVNGGNLSLHFWSDKAGGQTPSQFLGGLGLLTAPMAMVAENGRVQDIKDLLFPIAGSSPFDELFVASGFVGLTKAELGQIIGDSDYVASRDLIPGGGVAGPVGLASLFDTLPDGTPSPEAAIIPGDIKFPLLERDVPLTQNPGDVVTIEFEEPNRPGDTDNPKVISDVLVMKVLNLGNNNYHLSFGFWSEDPTMDYLTFESRSGTKKTDPKQKFYSIKETGHPPIAQLLFGTKQRPFDLYIVGSDPVVPEPGVWAMLGSMLIPVGLHQLRRRRS